MGEIQTRTEDGDLHYYTTVVEAFAAAETDDAIWKISFALPSGTRIRLVRTPTGFVQEDLVLPEAPGAP